MTEFLVMLTRFEGLLQLKHISLSPFDNIRYSLSPYRVQSCPEISMHQTMGISINYVIQIIPYTLLNLNCKTQIKF